MAQTREQPVESSASVSYVCDDCGRVHNRNNPPCNDCGSMNLSSKAMAENPSLQIDESESRELVRNARNEITGLAILVYVIGLASIALGAIRVVEGSALFGPALFAAGVVATPATRRRIERQFSRHLSPVTVLGVYLALFVGGLALELSL